MSINLNATILQSGTPLLSQNQVGAIAQDRLSLSYDGDKSLSDKYVFSYGQWVQLGVNKGAAALAATTTVGKVLGIVKYENSGVIDVGGYQQATGFYTNIPVLKQGVIWIGSTGTVDLDSTLYLYVDPSDTTNYGKVRNGSASGAIDISTIAKVAKVNNSDNLVLINVQIL
jgi:hypothetical protein